MTQVSIHPLDNVMSSSGDQVNYMFDVNINLHSLDNWWSDNANYRDLHIICSFQDCIVRGYSQIIFYHQIMHQIVFILEDVRILWSLALI